MLLLITALSLAFSTISSAPERPRVGISGWVKNTTFWDTRQVDGVRDDDYSLFPKDRRLDVQGNDINAFGDWNMLAIDTTLSLTVGNIFIGRNKAVELLGEVDVNFLGVREANINSPEMTFGYLALNWSWGQLLFGQYELPLYVVDAAPNTVSYGYGSPIEPFGWIPQLRFTYKSHNGWTVMASAHTEIDEEASVGFAPDPTPTPFVLPPTLFDSQFIRNSKFPTLALRVRKDWGPTAMACAGVQYRIIKPRLVTDANYKVHEHVGGVSAYALVKFLQSKARTILKFMYSENGFADGILGTYGIRSISLPTHRFTYTPQRFVNAWVDCQASNPIRWNPGIFAGISKNLGTANLLSPLACDPGYGFTSYKQELMASNFFENNQDLNINWLLKVIPRLYVIFKSVQLGLELEYNCVSYGDTINQRGQPACTHLVNHMRFLTGLYYYF